MPRPKHPTLAPWYRVYLASRWWKDLRARLLQERGKKCADCGKYRKLTLHHITYARVLQERDEDLRFLCNKCHRYAHRYHDVPYIGRCYIGNKAAVLRDREGSMNEDSVVYPRRRG